ncbi:MAG: transglycosylase domain-containing protein [Patescibacteria group bacterium]|nr:transglycosylase domain-containing protein [Patescibacteria group bacterium]
MENQKSKIKNQNRNYSSNEARSSRPLASNNNLSFLRKLNSFFLFASNKQISVTVGVIFLFLVASFYWFILKDLPFPTQLTSQTPSQTTKIFDRHGALLYEIYVNQNRTIVPLSQIPLYLREATISIEDKDFYRHGGINVVNGMLRAVKAMVINRQGLQGGSTITQQLVKTSLLTPERTIIRKIKEVVLAVITDKIYSKDQILAMYLNRVPYGGTAWGVEAASEKYFNKKVSQLGLAESSMLAGLPAAPTLYSPLGSHPELAKKRQAEVLGRMREDGYITRQQEEEAEKEILHYNLNSQQIKAPHFVMYVKDLLEKKYGENLVERGGLQVTTTLDLPIQNFAQQTVASEVAKLKTLDVGNGAALVTEPATGEILAMVGSRNYFDTTHDGNVNVTLALRQPGSSIKPVNYALGLLKGATPATLFIDEPTCFANIAGQKPYCPVNYDGKFHGPVQLRFALGNSINIPAVKMLAENGVHSMVATASAMGISTWTDESRFGLSLTLGGAEVRMTDMATVYGVFANAGARVDLNPVLKVVDSSGRVLEENKQAYSWDKKQTHSLLDINGKRVLPWDVTYLISHILLDNNARSMEFGDNSPLRVSGHSAVSVKTGTTDDKRDNWTIGYTPSYVVAVWVGNNDNTPMNPYLSSGITGAAPIWNKIMTYLLKDSKDQWPLMPSDIVGMQICSLSGKLPGDTGCPARFEYFIKGTEPTQVDDSRKNVLVDKTTGGLAKPGQTDNVEEQMHTVVKDAFTGFCVDCSSTSSSTLVTTWKF